MTVNRHLVTVVGRSVGLNEYCVGGTLSSNFDRIHYIVFSLIIRSKFYKILQYIVLTIFFILDLISFYSENELFLHIKASEKISPNVNLLYYKNKSRQFVQEKSLFK